MFSRSMAQMLEAGVEIRKALKTASRNSPDSRLPGLIENVNRRITSGATLADALNENEERFPPLFRDLVNVGEQTGAMPEVFASLSRYYESRLKQVRDFRSAISWPVFQLVIAVGVIGLLIFIVGFLPPQANGEPVDIVGLGLHGATGAMIWLVGSFGLGFALIAGWIFANRNLAGQTFLHPFLLGLPQIGSCMKSFAIARFSWCFALTQQAGMSIRPSLNCSLKATANGAYVMAEPVIWDALQQGETFADAVASSGLFPEDYIQFLETAEQSGTVPEELDRMSHVFESEAVRALQRLASIVSTLVWLFIAGFIIFFIFRIFLTFIMPNYQIDGGL